ncbi:MAG: hypothetical protein M1821_005845 [Bathelium mastoideum]|nr:MAG: hypothetical protein M1821_005845 [Bathelium mastoideum]
MASQVTPDGKVLPPLNISAPAPLINLRGFQWGTVDEKILGPQPSHAATPPYQRAPVTPAAPQPPAALPAPRLPLSAAALPAQFPGQLGLVPGLPEPHLPGFPLEQFQGAYAGNGFNLIFRPRAQDEKTQFLIPPKGPEDNILELNLTTEQLTFGWTIGDIPNRGFSTQSNITLAGFPYLQTVQDVTNKATGKGDSPTPTAIHFETGMWLNVPPSAANPKNGASVVRMASIPHGTTINAQCLAPLSQKPQTPLGGYAGPPEFDTLDTTPIAIKTGEEIPFLSMDAGQKDVFRIPQDLEIFKTEGTITTAIIKNPNLVLQNAIKNQTITETISFEVSTGSPKATLTGGGTTNISFLLGDEPTPGDPDSDPKPNAHAASMKSKFWIETVAYEVHVPELTTTDTVLLKPHMPNDSAPTPVFAITPPPQLPSEGKVITVPGIQIQYSQTVNLNFAKLTWPHVSVATLVPTGPQPFTMT